MGHILVNIQAAAPKIDTCQLPRHHHCDIGHLTGQAHDHDLQVFVDDGKHTAG
jgi:hypothetical protein